MKKSYMKYYENSFSPMASLKFMIDALFTMNSRKKLSLINRQKDYIALAEKPELLALHKKINEALLNGIENWPSYDYGEGYFYQSFEKIGIRGFRNTEKLVEKMNLKERLKGMSVLEIGSNAGFIALSVASEAKKVAGFDIAPHLIDISKIAAEHLSLSNADFQVSSFEDFKSEEKFDAVLSFANHSTYDGNTKQSLEDYFDRCVSYMNPKGLFLFESHPPAHEGDGLEVACKLIEDRFDIESREILEYGSFLDTGRTFIVARLKS